MGRPYRADVLCGEKIVRKNLQRHHSFAELPNPHVKMHKMRDVSCNRNRVALKMGSKPARRCECPWAPADLSRLDFANSTATFRLHQKESLLPTAAHPDPLASECGRRAESAGEIFR